MKDLEVVSFGDAGFGSEEYINKIYKNVFDIFTYFYRPSQILTQTDSSAVALYGLN